MPLSHGGKTVSLLYSYSDSFNPYTAKTAANREISSLLYDSLIKTDNNFSHVKCDALDVINAYTNIGTLAQEEEYQVEEGVVDMCKAIQDLVNDSIEEGRVEGRETGIALNRIENAKNLLDILSDEIIAERIQLPLATVQALRAEQANS